MTVAPSMQFNWLNATPTAAYAVTLSLFAIVTLRAKSVAAWPFLFALSCADLAYNVCGKILFSPAHQRAYTYLYWYGAIVLAILRLFVISDIIRAIPRIDCAPPRLMAFFVVIAFVVTGGSFYLAGGNRILHVVANLQICVALCWGIFALILFFSMDTLGVAWTGKGLRVASGYLAGSLITLLAGYAETRWTAFVVPIDALHLLSLAAVWSYWSWAMAQPAAASVQLTTAETATLMRLLSKLLPPSSTRFKQG